MLLTRDQILSAEDRPTSDVDVPEWGGTVRIRSLSGAERARIESESQQRSDGKTVRMDGLRELYVSLSAIGEDGERLFTEKDVEELGNKSAAALDRVMDAVIELNALGDGVDELEGNS
ncbi:MAG: phage tail assembly chaperone [Acidimicrobiia bacterium]|nr:phage tail assembly chaperone [Acidimicrobiia bacterium]